jgi:hypothetical protein
MPYATTEPGSVIAPLRELAVRDAARETAPYDFAEFTRRSTARKDRRWQGIAPRVLRLAAMVAPLAVLLGIAGVRHRGVDIDASATPAPALTEAALVSASAAGRVNDLEDRIAWFDAMISEAPVAGLSTDDRAALASGRDVLANSLQQVRYAQTLLATD